jgi:multimeric flavodoxin WrbA
MIKLKKILKENNLYEAFADSTELQTTISYLKSKKKVLLLTTSNRWEGDASKGDVPKSTILAQVIQKVLGEKATLVDVTKLNIFPCEGNVSKRDGNNCGVKAAMLKDKEKNPSGELRCWASFNNKTDELYKVSNPLLESDAVVFFGSIRWGQTNGFYQKLIERLTWLENRHSTLGEDNILKDKDCGFIAIGQNWNGQEVVKTQKQVHKFFGFQTPDELYWNWQYTTNPKDESQESYKKAYPQFKQDFKIK